MGFGENLISYHFEKFPLKLTFRTEKVILFGADRFDSWIKVFHSSIFDSWIKVFHSFDPIFSPKMGS